MRVIHTNLIEADTLSTSDELSGFEVESVLTDIVADRWQSENASATVEFDLPVGCDSIAVFGTNAYMIGMSISNPRAGVWHFNNPLWGDGSSWHTGKSAVHVTNQDGDQNSVWICFTALTVAKRVVLELTATESVYAGVITGGISVRFPDPLKGLKEPLIDTSLEIPLNNEEVEVVDGITLRQFVGQLLLYREDDYYTFMSLNRKYKKKKMAWKVTEIDHTGWALYGRLTIPAEGTHTYHRHSYLDFHIKEST